MWLIWYSVSTVWLAVFHYCRVLTALSESSYYRFPFYIQVTMFACFSLQTGFSVTYSYLCSYTSLYIYLSVFPQSRFVLCLSSLQYTESGVLVLLLRLSQELYMKNPEELVITLDLLSRLVTFNTVFYLFLTFIAECIAYSKYLKMPCFLMICILA